MNAKKRPTFEEIYKAFGPEKMNWISDLTRASPNKSKLLVPQAQLEQPVEAPPLPDISQMSMSDLRNHPQIQQYAQSLGVSVDDLLKQSSSE
jgi:hypothetical protein